MLGFIVSLLFLTGKNLMALGDGRQDDAAVEVVRTLELKPFDIGLLAIATLVDSVAIFGKTVAFQSSASGFVSLLSFINIVYALTADVFLFQEKLDSKEVVAASIIFAVTIIIAVIKSREGNKD